jgi:hypothetical protein
MTKQYITFKKTDELPKTSVWKVVNVSKRTWLGEIRWYGPWRQYCFFPDMETLFSRGCMAQINQFIMKQMEKRKK